MRFSSVITIVAAAFADSAQAVSQPGTLALRFNKEDKTNLVRSQSNGPLDSVLNNYRTIAYSVNFTLGTPPQSMATYVDTGSSDFIVIAKGASFCEPGTRDCISGFYDQNASSTSEDMRFTFHAGFGDSTQVDGPYLSDTLGLDGATIPNVPVAVATSGKVGGASFIGFMGMGYNSSEGSAQTRIVPTVLDSLVNAGQIATKTFSLWLDNLYSSSGTLLFGGVDTSKFYGNLSVIDIIKASPGGRQEYLVSLNSMNLRSSTESLDLNFPTNHPVLLDSGASTTSVPWSVLNSLERRFNLTYSNNEIMIPCAFANDTASIEFQFSGPNGPIISVPLSELVRSFNNKCSFGLQPWKQDTGPLILGDTFLRSAYVLYNLDDNVIGLAQSNFNPGPSNIIPLNANSDGTILLPSNTVFSSQASPTAAATSSGFQGVGPEVPNPTDSAIATGNAGLNSLPSSSTTSSTSSTSSSSPSSSSIPFNLSNYLTYSATTYSTAYTYNTAVTSPTSTVSPAKNAAGAVVVGKSVYLGAWFSTGLVLLGGVLGGGIFVL